MLSLDLLVPRLDDLLHKILEGLAHNCEDNVDNILAPELQPLMLHERPTLHGLGKEGGELQDLLFAQILVVGYEQVLDVLRQDDPALGGALVSDVPDRHVGIVIHISPNLAGHELEALALTGKLRLEFSRVDAIELLWSTNLVDRALV